MRISPLYLLALCFHQHRSVSAREFAYHGRDEYDGSDESDAILLGEFSDNEYEERILNSLASVDDFEEDRDEWPVFRRASPPLDQRTRRPSPTRNDNHRGDDHSRDNLQRVPLPTGLQLSSTATNDARPPNPNRSVSTRTKERETHWNEISTETVEMGSIYKPRNSQSSRGSTTAPAARKHQHAALLAITTPWVRRFLSSCHKDVLLPVPKDYCADAFNLVHLAPVIEHIGNTCLRSQDATTATSTVDNRPFPIYRQALQLLTQDVVPDELPKQVEIATTALYLLLHQRYVVSPRGLDMVRRRFLLESPTSIAMNAQSVDPIFGRCSSLSCLGMPLLPIGDSDQFLNGEESTDSNARFKDSATSEARRRAKRYCASCRRVFYHWDSKVEGCAWGTSFCHLFLMVHGAEVFGTCHRPLQSNDEHVARIFGFPLHPSVQASST